MNAADRPMRGREYDCQRCRLAALFLSWGILSGCAGTIGPSAAVTAVQRTPEADGNKEEEFRTHINKLIASNVVWGSRRGVGFRAATINPQMRAIIDEGPVIVPSLVGHLKNSDPKSALLIMVCIYHIDTPVAVPAVTLLQDELAGRSDEYSRAAFVYARRYLQLSKTTDGSQPLLAPEMSE